MRKILTSFMGVPLTLLVVAALAAGGLFAFLAWRDREAISFASSVVSENSPIAELATRKIVWKVTHVGSTTSVDTIRETVYTIKVGYDLAQAEAPVVDKEAKTVTLTLPPRRSSPSTTFSSASPSRRRLLSSASSARTTTTDAQTAKTLCSSPQTARSSASSRQRTCASRSQPL